MQIFEMLHPSYKANLSLWSKYRLTYEGGDSFLENYVFRFSNLEDYTEFTNRKKVSYVPAFAKAAVNDVKNSIFQRATDITRVSGSDTYIKATKGQIGGVDLLHSTMNAFVGRKILPELLTIAKVGVYVDMPAEQFGTLADIGDAHPYLYVYKAEDILNWTYKAGTKELQNLLLRDNVEVKDSEFNLTTGLQRSYRYLTLTADGVEVRVYDMTGQLVSTTVLTILKIPFVIFEISDSLLRDIANYQIALTNLASSDIAYAVKGNFTFYTEQYDPRSEATFIRRNNSGDAQVQADGFLTYNGGTQSSANNSNQNEIKVGVSNGRRYPIGTDRPEFISPSAEPLRASMEKQTQLKEEIRQLIALAVTNIRPQQASAESKGLDQQGLEAGLSYIGLELETGERHIHEYWTMYEGTEVKGTINYPQKYSLLPDSEKRKSGLELTKLVQKIPSITYKRELAKEIASLTVGVSVSDETLLKIQSEIEKATVIDIDPEVLQSDYENGFVDPETASLARGYPEGTFAKAKVAQEERLKLIAESQSSGIRGIKESQNNNVAANDKQGKNQRGKATFSRDNDNSRGE